MKPLQSTTIHQPTLADIARHLNISPRAVSQVLSGNAQSTTRVSGETAKKVRALAKKWNYRPSASARAMKGASLRQMGFVVEYNLQKQRLAPVIAMPAILGINDQLAGVDWNLTIIREERGGDIELATPRYLREHLLDGIIVNSVNPEKDQEILRDLKRFHIPHVLLNGAAEYNCISLDDRNGVAQAVDYLIKLGHTRIAYVGPGKSGHHSVMARQNAYRDAMTSAGLVPHAWHYQTALPDNEREESVRTEISESRGREILAFYRQARPTAIVCYSDLDALLVMQRLQEDGIRIPRDVSVVGYDDLPFVHMHTPALTTIRSDFYQMGRSAAEMLLRLIQSPSEKIAAALFESRLIERKSAGPVSSS